MAMARPKKTEFTVNEGMVVMMMMMMVMMGGGGAKSAAEAAEVAALFVFGDSYADTGNHRNSSDTVETEYKPWRVPYGITWPGSPAGRYSDGYVFTDFFASYLGVSNPTPYRTFNESVSAENGTGTVDGNSGINFAFGGSGVFPTQSFCPNVSTQILQLQDAVDNGFVSSATIANSSIALLTVNGNDYTQYVNDNGSLANIAAFVEAVVEQIGLDIVSLVDLGFTKLAISNMLPAGCLPTSAESFNFTSCSATTNTLTALHNSLLTTQIEALQDQLPDVEFITLDFFSVFNTTLLQSGSESNLRPCCDGIEDSYYCGSVDSNGTALYTVCESPELYSFWDDFHPTDATWRNVSALLFQTGDLSLDPPTIVDSTYARTL